ncbi:MAG TPA: amidohydrolase family protein [Gemmataceae bacterium]|nr:amidohydrolase family protein [Gemmataceae bacterium]
MMRLRGRHYATGERIEIACHAGKIESIAPATKGKVDCEAEWIAPAFFDLQINGCDGISFNSATLTIDDARHVVEVCRRHGIAGLCPTLITNSADALVHGFATLANACASDSALARALPCFHLEGPYISPEDGPRGAHPRAYVSKPNWDEFRRWQEAAGGRIRLVTLAPELEGALTFIEKLTASGVVVAIGHTSASGSEIRAAVKAGAKLSTHLGNGAHAVLPRHDNYIWEQLAADELWASIICDGHHLPPAVIRSILRVKTASRTILTCDASSVAGLPPGKYRQWDQELEVLPEGKIVVPGTPYLAGSWAFTDLSVGIGVRDGGVTLAEAIDMAGARPRELLGLPAQRLLVGDPAELILFNFDPQISQMTQIRRIG